MRPGARACWRGVPRSGAAPSVPGVAWDGMNLGAPVIDASVRSQFMHLRA